MRMRYVIILLTLFILLAITPVEYSNAESPDISYFDVKLVNNDGTEAEGILSHSYSVDTFSDATGTTFILKANISLQAKPANLFIESNEGTFNCRVTITGLSSYLEEAGIRIQLQDDEKTYISDCTKTNNFEKIYLVNDTNSRAVLRPNVMYPMTIRTLDDVEHDAPPQKVENVVIEFTVHLKEGMHQVAFFNGDELVEAYKIADGQAIRPLPAAPERNGYEFNGWFTQDGRSIPEGYVVTEDDGDIIQYARWTAVVIPSDSFNWIIPVIVGAVIAGLIFAFVLVKRHKTP